MARHKPDPLIIASLGEATAAVGEIAALDREIAAIEADLEAEIQMARERAEQRASMPRIRRKSLNDAVCVFATLNKAELFNNARTLDLVYGKIGFRLTPPTISQERGVTKETTIAKCRELGLLDGIRVKEKLNKEALLGWPDERLALVGVVRRQRDEFFLDTAREKLPEEV